MSHLTYKYIKQNKGIQTYISRADDALYSIGYTEHSTTHAEICAATAHLILSKLGHPERVCELAQIAAYMHDIGNVVNRQDHAQTGAVMAFRLLDCMGMPPEEIAAIIAAIGNHDENTARPINPIAAAVILADKCDVRRSRVRHPVDKQEDEAGKVVTTIQDIHDRVNYACVKSQVHVCESGSVLLDLVIDEEICPLLDYFLIFTQRMQLCRNAADSLGTKFELIMNGSRIV